MNRFDVTRYHKPLSVGIFGGGTLVLLVSSLIALFTGRMGLGIALGLAFLVIGIGAAFYFLDMFVWQPRREAQVEGVRMQQFNKSEQYRRDRERQRTKGLRG